MPPETLHLSSVVRRPLLDSSGDKIGRVEDLIVLLGRTHPPVTGLLARIAGRELFVPIDRVAEFTPRRISLSGTTVNLARFERRGGELLLERDVATRHLINLVGARIIRANEIELACVDGVWEVIGVDPSPRGGIRRVLPRRLARLVGPGKIVDWESIEPFVSHVPTARLRIPYRKLARLRPAQIADLVEASSHDEGEEIIKAVGLDRELEADVFEELDPEHQREFLTSRSTEDAAALLARMAPDDAADLLMDLDQERRLPILEALPERQHEKVRALLSYNPETAGGLMSPDFLSLAEQTTVTEALEAVRKSDVAPEALTTVFLTDADGRLSGAAAIVRLLKSAPESTLRAVGEAHPVALRAEEDVHAIVRKMSDFNLSATPVVDADHHILGVVTVDDVLELLMPDGWRRDFGMTAAED
jgi:CBS domain-containing protein